MTDDYSEDLKILIQIQNIDNKLGLFELEKNKKKDEYEKIKINYDEIKKEYDTVSAELNAVNANIKKLEEENSELNKKIEVSRNKMFSVKSQREFDALKAEIKTAQHTISENETKEIGLLEIQEKLNKKFPEIDEKVNGYQNQMNSISSDIDKYLESIKEQSGKYEDQKNEFLKKLKPRSVQLYAKLANAHKTPALAKISVLKEKNKEHLTCSVCNIDIPPQTVIEIRKKTKIFPCDSCNRILFWEE